MGEILRFTVEFRQYLLGFLMLVVTTLIYECLTSHQLSAQ